MDEDAIRNATGRLNTPMEYWGCTNSLKYHTDRFHTYRNGPNKRDPDVAEQAKQSIQKYAQSTSIMGGIRGDKDSQGQWGHKSSMEVRSIVAERRIQLTRSWKEEGFG